MISWRHILIPFSWLFGCMVILRNNLYNLHIFPTRTYKNSLIGIGNIRIGGTGKSPFTEYLIRILKNNYSLATLSRGYGRKTKGFLLVIKPDVDLYGDEPSQFKTKFPEITVAVSESRIEALNELTKNHQVIILDDSFQHRRVNAGQYWVLLENEDLLKPIFLLPAGNYREGLTALSRAQNILITKCPNWPEADRVVEIRKKLKLSICQSLFFSQIKYMAPKRIFFSEDNFLFESVTNLENLEFILVFTGISNNNALKQYLSNFSAQKYYFEFPDHYQFSIDDLKKISNKYESLNFTKMIILTTEKDAQRLKKQSYENFIRKYPVYFLPIEFIMQPKQADLLQEIIETYIESNLH